MTSVKRLLVGAGPQALTIAARWVHEQPDAVAAIEVIDPSGRWLHAWAAALAGQQIDVLRSPGVHHPAPDEMAFVWAHAAKSEAASTRSPSMAGPLRRPSTEAFASFCAQMIASSGLETCVRAASVVALEPSAGGWSVQLCNGASIEAEVVVWAGNTRRERVPDGLELYRVLVHAGAFDLESVVPGECLAVVGGGQSAGQLALEAQRRGASVMLLSRAPCRTADLDVDAGWLMEDHLGPFRSTVDPSDRRRILEQVRCGSMTEDLDAALTRSEVCRLHGVGEVDVRRTMTGASVRFASAEVGADRVVLATGWVADARADEALARLIEHGAPHVDGLPVLDRRLQWLDGLFVSGALAGLTLGPAAGNLGGARAAADALAPLAPA